MVNLGGAWAGSEAVPFFQHLALNAEWYHDLTVNITDTSDWRKLVNAQSELVQFH